MVELPKEANEKAKKKVEEKVPPKEPDVSIQSGGTSPPPEPPK
jgi:hypothetical protein